MNYSSLLLLFIITASNGTPSIPSNILDYKGTPINADDRSSLVFSDQGAWFGYGFPDTSSAYGGFSGPFLLTQENGKWSSRVLSQLVLSDKNGKSFTWDDFNFSSESFSTHLSQSFSSEDLNISQILFFKSAHSAIITTHIQNISDKTISLSPQITGTTFLKSLKLENENGMIKIISEKSPATGYINVLAGDCIPNFPQVFDSNYTIGFEEIILNPNQSKTINISHTFIFPEYNWLEEQKYLALTNSNILEDYITKKEGQYNNIITRLAGPWREDPVYKILVAKSLLTLQNNWRVPAGELKHSGLFPSYHYVWFHGFWAWDSWKHAVAIAQFDTGLAKEQIRAMYDFMDENGFIADCIYRDTTIENHNFRNTKPPLSAWAVWKIFEADNDLSFLNEMYPKLYKQHFWWYQFRDNDQDGLCEYGSKDGTIIAAKWESGMDNAVRFDSSQILKNNADAYSLNQESVDLNSYLYAEKSYLTLIAVEINKEKDAAMFRNERDLLKSKIQSQFYDSESNWFYDTSLDDHRFIKVMGCEGWLPLWAKVASKEQALAVKNNIMRPDYFNAKIPLQTLSASHPKYTPDGGYWRGPVWLDQSYFGIKGLINYNFNNEADELSYKLFHNAEGVLEKGKSIRENYNPETGAGLEAENFSWSAAHYLLLLLKE